MKESSSQHPAPKPLVSSHPLESSIEPPNNQSLLKAIVLGTVLCVVIGLIDNLILAAGSASKGAAPNHRPTWREQRRVNNKT